MVAEVAERSHAWLDVTEEVDELITSRLKRHLPRIRRNPGMKTHIEAPRLILAPLGKVGLGLLAPQNRVDEALRAAGSLEYEPEIRKQVSFE